NTEIYHLTTVGGSTPWEDANAGYEARNQIHGGFANNLQAQQDGVTINTYGSFRPQDDGLTREINQVTMNAPAEYRTSSTYAKVGKAGTNQLHGEIYANVVQPRLNALPVGQATRVPQKP